MSVDKIKPFHDSRVSLKSITVNSYTYGYMHSLPCPNTARRGTIFLIHGFPDLSFGWRYQIPLLTSLGLEVIALDCLGYGRSDAPGSHEISAYTYKRISMDIRAMCVQFGFSRIFIGGHDWGGAIVYRVAQYLPQLVIALFSICTPYEMPRPQYMPLKQLVEKVIPNFRYQLHFQSGELEKAIKSPQEIRNFLNSMYGARSVEPDGKRGATAFNAEGNVGLDLLVRMGKTKLLSDEEMDYYVHEFARHGINGPLNWYRSREQMFLDDLDLFFEGARTDPNKWAGEKAIVKVKQPCLYVFATKDTALQEWMSQQMESRIPRMTRKTVNAGHWALWEQPDEINTAIKDWITPLLENITRPKL